MSQPEDPATEGTDHERPGGGRHCRARSSTPLTHYSLTRYIAQVLGMKPLSQGAGAPDLAAAFGL